ncbi:protein FAM166B-like [Branchiostoma floridae]|uniref:Ciliary microtubule inner protein 2B n=1 Tax=Branchiostoma floridae TaxID=7739 RepID=C3YTW1_BRAFL|nr:protein FAM166B-like [Branchiostoma floridae]|eukprot:XP_002600226.1 hypothetical protein BRAFLDRAFT_118265 [Branchiostoma floridae]
MPQDMPPKKSILMTPDPYHTPGYLGYCPQFKYQIGSTFGNTTHRLLTNPNVAASGSSVLTDTFPRLSQGVDKAAFIRTRTASWGDQKLTEKMVPGYTGYIPKMQNHYFGSRYADTCGSAIADFESDQRGHTAKRDHMRTLTALQTGKLKPDDSQKNLITASYQTPLKPIARQAKPYYSPGSLQHIKSPYRMSNAEAKKNFMSGYTGFVPKARGLMGMGYPVVTNAALCEFTNEMGKNRTLKTQPITIKRETKGKMETQAIYPEGSGLVPHYTGHIPAQKFKFGDTFGHSTYNALKIGTGMTPQQEAIISVQ